MIYNCAINPITNPNPVYSHSYTWQYKCIPHRNLPCRTWKNNEKPHRTENHNRQRLDQVSNPLPHQYVSGALPLCQPARFELNYVIFLFVTRERNRMDKRYKKENSRLSGNVSKNECQTANIKRLIWQKREMRQLSELIHYSTNWDTHFLSVENVQIAERTCLRRRECVQFWKRTCSSLYMIWSPGMSYIRGSYQ
jgi:hypothetical protein